MEKTLHIHIYRKQNGVTGVVKNEQGIVQNDNQTVKLTYDTPMYHNYIKHIKSNGVIKVDVLGFIESKKDGKFIYHKEDADLEKATKDIDVALKGDVEVQLTPDQKEVKELKEQVAKLLNKTDSTPEVNEELTAARSKYLEVIGKKPHHTKNLAKLNKEIEDKLNS